MDQKPPAGPSHPCFWMNLDLNGNKPPGWSSGVFVSGDFKPKIDQNLLGTLGEVDVNRVLEVLSSPTSQTLCDHLSLPLCKFLSRAGGADGVGRRNADGVGWCGANDVGWHDATP